MLSLNKKISIYLILFSSLIFSYLLGENSSGGSKHDYFATQKYIEVFQIDFYSGFELFRDSNELHFPFFYLIIGNISKITGITFIHYFYLIISSLIPLAFYNALKKKFLNINNDSLFFLSILIFFSPYFRSSAVWLTTDNLALLFFVISINFFLKIELENKTFFKNSLLCFLFLVLSSYIRHYYAIFFFLYFYISYNKFSLSKNLIIIIFNIILSIPALFYLNFITKGKSFSEPFYFLSGDFIFNFLFLGSLFLFYLIPFLINDFVPRYFKERFSLKKNIIFLTIILSVLIISFYTLPNFEYGGGVFYKLSKIYYINIFYFFSILGCLIILLLIDDSFKNYLIFLILIIIFPLTILFQKYYDPLLYIVLFTLMNSNFITKLIYNNKIKISFVAAYFLFFLIFSNIYYM